MGLNLIKHSINTEELLFSLVTEIETQDNFQIKGGREIKKILKSYSKTTVSTKYVTDKAVTLEGTVSIWVIYTDEKGCLSSDEHTSFFSKTLQSDANLTDGTVTATVCDERVETKIIGGASVSVCAKAGIEVLVHRVIEKEIICDIDNKNIEKLKGRAEGTIPIALGEKNLVVEEEFSLGHSQPAAKCILRKHAQAVIEETKIMGGKVMVKGRIKIFMLYHTTEGKRPGCFEESFPFSQLIDVPNISDNCRCESAVKILFCELTPRASGDDEIRSFSASVKLSVLVKAYCEEEIPTIVDAYSLVGGYAFKKEELALRKLKDTFCEKFIVKKNLEFTDGAIASVIDMWCEVKCSSSKLDEDKLKITGTILVNLLAYDIEGTPECYERPVDFEYIREFEETLQNTDISYEININQCSYTILSANAVSVAIEPAVTVSTFSTLKCEVLTDAVEDEEVGVKADRPSSIVLYFADSGERVWDIARRYNSSAEEIKTLNSVTEDILTEPKKFIIPTK